MTSTAWLHCVTRFLSKSPAGEYGYHLEYFRTMLASRSVDVLQADIGRCAGLTEWLRIAATCAALQTPYSAHCGPSIHVQAATVPT